MTNNTIAAISTPLGPGGIGIVRISGPDAYAIMQRLFFRKHQNDHCGAIHSPEKKFTSHRVYYGHLMDTGHRAIIDEVLAIYMKRPRSYTREDVVEFHAHSGFVVLDRILSAVVDAGADLAAPGAFSQRAFLNGRIDLTQAEAVIDLINAPCETAVQMASRQVAGGLRDVLETITANIAELQATCEADIEFPETTDQLADLQHIKRTIRADIAPEIAALIQRQKDTAVYQEGVLLAIAGIPNVGKSSLLNRLVERETAIVSEVPGTTRDIVRDYFSINGVPVVICDTAGIHDTKDPVECVGIKKARDHFQRANLVLLVLEATRAMNAFEETLADDFKNTSTIVVVNKDDVAIENAVSGIQKKIKTLPHIRVSAKTGVGIDALKALIFKDIVSGNDRVNHDGITPNLRQRKILERVKQELHRLERSAEAEQSIEVASSLLNNILHLLEEISGNRNKEDLYELIFSQFCIGK